ncbi:MAG: DUF362 domain-containing protein [Lachnospiraceae bacterium]|nr:DUF362 domain-containing protein [Lachnospiraceae bacterium]
MEARSKVVIVPCRTYNKENVYRAVKAGVDALGGIGAFIRHEEKVLVKPNYLTAADADKAVTTHPAVIEAVLRLVSEYGCADISCGDSPGHGKGEIVHARLGMDEIMEKYGVRPAEMNEEVLTDFPEGMIAKRFYFAKEITEADAIINVCKMKTHALERITGAVKNVYGFICGVRKAAGHVSYPNPMAFARMLADIHRATDIRLNIMDGIVAMEGNGPGSGDPTPMNVLLFSADPVALDATYCRLVHLEPWSVPTCGQGQIMGIGTYEEDKIDLLLAEPAESGAEAEDGGEITESAAPKLTPVNTETLVSRFGNPNFNVDRRATSSGGKWGFRIGLLNRFTKRPYIDKKACVRCGVCVAHCPVPDKAVNFTKGKDKPPVYDYSRCIRCYCCQEMCPQHAIHVKGI